MATGAVAGVAAAGLVIQITGQKKAAKAQRKAAEASAMAKRLQAVDLLKRFEFNAQTLKVEGEKFKQKQIASFAKGGIDVGSGTTLTTLEATNSAITHQINIQRMEAKAKEQALLAGADVDLQLAGDISSASRLQTAGTFLTGASRIGANAGAFDVNNEKLSTGLKSVDPQGIKK